MKRREFLVGSVIAIGLLGSGKLLAGDAFEVTKTKDEWKKILTPEQFHILREEGTEAPFTSKLVDEHREGTFHCVGCDYPLFESNTKFDSGTGWPSFYFAIERHIATKQDNSMFMKRTEYHCARCGGHHGHVFDDGPKPTGLRYCSNGAVLTFKPSSKQA
ncbi:MAG: peptide-methionine (R)-S-oxide reductase MsrB [Alphaproteobacteria bacterium]|nr:peptide-methionine (R)-S-oxide reductase MsrB [Alphaproteobacteria bacterium]